VLRRRRRRSRRRRRRRRRGRWFILKSLYITYSNISRMSWTHFPKF
jgi:hypothetical protein